MDSNKLIAEFMGMELEHDMVWLHERLHKDLIRGRDYYEYADTKGVGCDGITWTHVLVDTEYHWNWNWLMPVVVKCREESNAEDSHWEAIYYALEGCDKDVIYNAVVEFIKWYNQKQYESKT